MVDNNAVGVHKKSVARAGIALAKDVNQLVQKEVNAKNAEKFVSFPVDHAGKCDAIVAGLRVHVGGGYIEARDGTLRVPVPRAVLQLKILIRNPAAVHN